MNLSNVISKKETGLRIPFSPVLRLVDREAIVPLLQKVEKPGRYVGGEFGIAAKKNPESVRARALFSYPDTYELGMSNQGLKILYDCVNRREDFLADRAFLPWPDFAQALRGAGIPLYSLDRFLPAGSFDLWGFNTAHELHYTNLLYALQLAGIPLLRKERRACDPFIITGGTAVSNPLPLFDFMDAIFMGDGEDAILEILETIAAGKESGRTRLEILCELQKVEGLVLPEFYKVHETSSGVMQYSGRTVQKRTYRAGAFAVLDNIVLPSIDITQDRLVVEVNRGCAQSCRFCHAGFWKRPLRHAEVDTLVQAAEKMLRKTGSDSISLHSLSIADYPWLEELVVEMANKYGPQGISLSLPSLRVQVKTIPVLEMTSGIRRSSVTFALEAGSEIMRERIFKKSSEENLHYLIKEIFSRGWDLVKVYFMTGLPDPEGREVDDLIRALNALGELARQSGQRKNINVTVSLFVPKPFTTFQWEKQQTPEYFLDALRRIKSSLHTRRVHIKSPDPWMGYVEGLLSRSDTRISPYILQAFEAGARFDSWDDQFRKDIWQDIIARIPENLLHQWMDKREGLSDTPWEHIVEGFSREKLEKDYRRYEAVTEENMHPPHKQALVESNFPAELLKPVLIPPEKFERKCVLLIEYSKSGSFIYVSHLDTANVIRKASRRAGLPMTFSRGFNKHEIFHFTDSLPLFFHSESETLYVELYQDIDTDVSAQSLSENLPDGLMLKNLKLLPSVPRKIQDESKNYCLNFTDEADAEEAFRNLDKSPETISFIKKDRKKKNRHRGAENIREVQKKVRSALLDLSLNGKNVYFSIDDPETGALSMAELMTRILNLPVEVWNSRVRITKMKKTAAEPRS